MPTASLTPLERRIIKRLLNEGHRNQDIHAAINHGRRSTINFGRIAEIKKDKIIQPANDDELALFDAKKRSYDPITGLNLYEDERLIRSRESMLLAVSVFNNPTHKFKTEVFSILSQIAWTYLLHEHYDRKGIAPINQDGTAFGLSYMANRGDFPLLKGMKSNILSIKQIRDEVEHKLFSRTDALWLPLFQANCLNYDKIIVSWFGPRLSLKNELSVSLQFAKLDINQAAQLNAFDVPAYISALDGNLVKDMTESEVNDIEYKFRVIYTLDSASKGSSNIQFLHPDSKEGKDVHNVLQKFKVADEVYPHKPMAVANLVRDRTGKKFTSNDHTVAWKRHNVRPPSNSKSPHATNKKYCIYHNAHKDYTYNDAWVDLLCEDTA